MRKKVIAGNWKMNNLRGETTALLTELTGKVKDATCEIIACVPFTNLDTALEATKNTNIKIGAQNCHWAKSGAFTGEISAAMLKEIGIEYVVLGHSERRSYFAETDETVKKRVRAALEAGLQVILCVGELLEEREAGVTKEVCAKQTKIALGGVSAEELSRVIIAYEPVWAIGTGKTATSEQADLACGEIRGVIEELYGKAAGDKMPVLYGGSMNAANADELLAKEHVDGGLIGGASLNADDFAAIITAASK